MKKFLVIIIILMLSACENSETFVMDEEVEETPTQTEVSSDETVEESVLETPDNSGELTGENDEVENEDIVEKQISSFDINQSIDDFGTIHVLTGAASAGTSVDFLPEGTHTVFNDHREFMAATANTRIIIYEYDNELGLPPSIFNIELFPGEMAGFESDGIKYLMIYNSGPERRELRSITSDVLSYKGIDSFDEYSNLLEIALLQKEPDEIVKYQLSSKENLSELNVCQIEQTRRIPGDPPQPKGFPLNYELVPATGDVNIAIVPVDFIDVPGDDALLEQWASEVYTLEEWSAFVTGGKLNYKVHFANEWVRPPREAKWYGCPSCLRLIQGDYNEEPVVQLQSTEAAINEVLVAGDDLYDWENIDFIMFMFPPRAEAEPHYVRLYSHGGNFRTPNAGRFDVPTFGGFMGWFAPEFTNFTVWDLTLHEVLHEQGLMGHGPFNGSDLSVMMNQHGYTKALLSWEAFLMGLYDEQQIGCLSIETLESMEEPFTYQLNSLDAVGAGDEGDVSLMVRLSDKEILVFEYRTDGPFSTLPSEWHGITVYTINVDKPQFRCDGCDDLTTEEYEERNFWRYLKDPTQNHPCINYRFHEVYGGLDGRFCGEQRFIHAPGAVLTYQNLQITILDDNVIEISTT